MTSSYAHQPRTLRAVSSLYAQGAKSVLVVCPTGGGKTRMGSIAMRNHVAANPERRGVVLVHRYELVEQWNRALQLHDVGIDRCSVLMAQTAAARGTTARATFAIFDEAHHYVAEEWGEVRKAYADVQTLGLSATPERSDGLGLGNAFQHLVVAAQIRELVAAGVLVPCRVIGAKEMLAGKRIALDPVDAFLKYTPHGQAVVFASNVNASKEYQSAFLARGLAAAHVDGKTHPEQRAASLAGFAAESVRAVCNVNVLTEGWDAPRADVCILARGCSSQGAFLQMCLDASTEILTARGFLGPDDLRAEDLVASVDLSSADPSCQWERPLAIVDRALDPSESMVAVRSPRLDLRVTGGHTIYHRHRIMAGAARSGWTGSAAVDRLAAPGQYEIPSSAVQASHGVALTDAELRVIGWYMTDGSINKGTRGLAIYQAEGSQFVGEIHRCLSESGLRYAVNRLVPTNAFPNAQPRLTFTVSHGMPRSAVERSAGLRGYAHLESYMHKDLSGALDEMTPRQLAVLLEAMHWGDGSKQSGQAWTRRSYHIATSRRLLADRLQSLCLRRGWSCNVSTESRDSGPFYFVHAKRVFSRHVGGSTSVDRPRLEIVSADRGERVWCVTVSAGAIIVRRNGKACVVGNCGRVLRAHQGKTGATLLDLAGVVNVLGPPDEDRVYSLEGRAIKRTACDEAICRQCGRLASACECGESQDLKPPTVTGEELVDWETRYREVKEELNPSRTALALASILRKAAEAHKAGKTWKEGAVVHRFRAIFKRAPDAETLAMAHRVNALSDPDYEMVVKRAQEARRRAG